MKRLILFIFVVFSLVSKAQNINPGADEIYRDDEIAFIYLLMTPEDSITLLDDIDIYTDEYVPTSFRFKNSLMDTTLEFSVGIRLRGNTSRGQPKRSLKIKFKEFDGSKFYGYKKFNLKAENNDPTMAREMLALQTFRNTNVPATRTHHVEVYLNGTYMGLYLNVEQLDDEFVKARFGNDTGNLYKCQYGATLEDNGQIYNNEIYEIEINDEINDRSILAHFVDVLNNTSDDSFKSEIEKVFNVQPFLRYLAVEVLLGHWDGYSYNQNNFYLYENPENGLMEFMPYDLDNTFGLDWLGIDWGTRNVLNWARQDQTRPLVYRILAVDEYYHQYTLEIRNLLNTYFSEPALFPQMDELKSRLADPILRDTYFPLTFGFTYQDFIDGYTIALGGDYGQLPYGLKPYVITRSDMAEEQLLITETEELFAANSSMYPNPNTGNWLIINSDIPVENISVLDVSGRLMEVKLDKLTCNQYLLQYNLKQGIYYVQIDNNTKRMMVNK